MIFIYIIGGFLLIVLTVFLLHKREEMTKNIKLLKAKKQEIIEINNQLDELHSQLDQMNDSISKVDHLSQKILSYRRS